MALRIVIDLDVEGADIVELYLTRGVLKMIDQEYQADGIDTPENIVDKLSSVTHEIMNRNKADIQRRLRLAKSRLDSLATRDERKSKLAEEIAKLETQLKA